MDSELKQNYQILNEIHQTKRSVGANALSLRTKIPPATIGRRMQALEFGGYIRKVSNKGRVLTASGEYYLQELKARLNSEQEAEKLRSLALSTNKQDMLDMLAVRRVLEMESISLACRRVTDDDLALLEKIVRQQNEEIAANRTGADQDFLFHLTLAKISGNTCIEQVLSLILTHDKAFVKLSVISLVAKNLPRSVSHRKLIEVLREKNVERARQLIAEHIDFYRDYVAEHL